MRKAYKKSDKTTECVCVHPSELKKDDVGKYKTYEDEGCPAMASSCTWDSKKKIISFKLEEEQEI